MIRITQEQIFDTLHYQAKEWDSEMWAKLAGWLFGGECTLRSDGDFDFVPNENYTEAFE